MGKRAFGEIVRRGRQNKGMSLRQLADRTGIDYSRLSRIEHGTRPAPDLATLRGLARSLDLDLVELLVSAGTAREVVEDLLWAERLSLSEALSELGAYRPEDSALLRKNTFEVDVVHRQGARCAVQLGGAALVVLSFSRCDRLLLEIPPETIVVFREHPKPLLGRVENVLGMRIQRTRRLGQLDNLVLEGDGFTLNAMESRSGTDERSSVVGQEVHVLIPVAAIRTRPVARKE